MNKDEEFVQSLYDEANDKLKEVYKEQKGNRDELLTEIARIMLTYTIIDNVMKMAKNEIRNIYSSLSKLITKNSSVQAKNQAQTLKNILKNTVNSTYNHYSYNAGLKDVQAIIDSNFKGKHFSDRVWNNETEVAKHLHKNVNDFLNGKVNVNQIKKDIEKTYNNSAYEIKRLTETEVNRCSSNAFDRFCNETGVEYVRYNATLDNRLCSDCSHYHDTVFKLSEKIEVPRHPLCRCFYTIEDDYYKQENNKSANSGANSGALTSNNDPDFKKREDHADQYYESVRRRDAKEEISIIAKNTGFNLKTIEKVYNHVFINKYDLDQGYGSFYPDYYMAQSWQRLREGKSIQEHDLIMLKHERLEYELMNRYNKGYREAHNITERKYNYVKALREYLKKNNLE